MPPKQNHDTVSPFQWQLPVNWQPSYEVSPSKPAQQQDRNDVSPFQWQLDPVSWQQNREASQPGREHRSPSVPLCDHLSIVKMACDDVEDMAPDLDRPQHPGDQHPGVTFIHVPLCKHHHDEPSPHSEEGSQGDSEDYSEDYSEDNLEGLKRPILCYGPPRRDYKRIIGCGPSRPLPTPTPTIEEEEEPDWVVADLPPSPSAGSAPPGRNAVVATTSPGHLPAAGPAAAAAPARYPEPPLRVIVCPALSRRELEGPEGKSARARAGHSSGTTIKRAFA